VTAAASAATHELVQPGPAASFGASHRSVIVGLAVSAAQTAALAVAAVVTGSVALKTQTVTSLADVAAGVFLVIGVVSSARPPDEQHPLGYGRERFFWSFVAAIGIFFGGFGVAVAETIKAALHPPTPGAYMLGYSVLAVVVLLDVIALTTGVRPLLRRAADRRISVLELLWRGTDPAVTTVVLGSAAGVSGGVVAASGLALGQLLGEPVVDTVASGIIGAILLATSLVLLRTNRELLTGRGVPAELLHQMQDVVSQRPGIVAVPDIFAVVVGPSSLIVDGDVIFEDRLDVPDVEAVIVDAATALRRLWPAVSYVYLNPVAAGRERRVSGESHIERIDG
jgi:cation diffusion facilitator family transporter